MSSDARDAYKAAISGATSYKPPENSDGTDAQAAFQAGIATTQANKPDIFQDSVSVQSDGSFQVDKNPLQQQLDNLQNQDDAFDFINTIQNQTLPQGPMVPGGQGILDANLLGYIKDPLVALGAFTTDPNENRNVYQLLINKMFQGNQPQMAGAQPLSQSAVEGLTRIGPTNFIDPKLSQGFLGDLASLFTGKNAAAVNLSELPGGGIASLPEFGQAGLDFTKEQGFKDYGKLVEGFITGATPLKYGKFLFDKTVEGAKDFPDFASSTIDKALTPIDELTKLIDSIGNDEEKPETNSELFKNVKKEKKFNFF
jgi:hypothetical protein